MVKLTLTGKFCEVGRLYGIARELGVDEELLERFLWNPKRYGKDLIKEIHSKVGVYLVVYGLPTARQVAEANDLHARAYRRGVVQGQQAALELQRLRSE